VSGGHGMVDAHSSAETRLGTSVIYAIHKIIEMWFSSATFSIVMTTTP